MQKVKETWQTAKERVQPKHLAISTGIAGISTFAIIPIQSFITYSIHELGKEASTDTIKILAVALIGLANINSIAVEANTLTKKQYSASTIATVTKIIIKDSFFSSLTGHTLNFLQAYSINPIQAFNFSAVVNGDGGRLFFENGVSVAVTLAIWNIFFNTLILKVSPENILERLRIKKTKN